MLTSISLAMTNQCDIWTNPAKVGYGECPEIIRHFVWEELNFSNYWVTHMPVIFHLKNRLKMLTLLGSLIVTIKPTLLMALLHLLDTEQ
jgi:hypothetical protein